ncbi:hypothetical protein J6590_042854 [Homalodisca vitripennis]|nr:hypothetical protein J6590_042854 [Homalodisca vitripennis]
MEIERLVERFSGNVGPDEIDSRVMGSKWGRSRSRGLRCPGRSNISANCGGVIH